MAEKALSCIKKYLQTTDAPRANPYLNPSDKEYRTFEGLYKDDMTRAKESLEELKESLSKTD